MAPPKAWKVLDSRYIVRDRWMTLRADRCETSASHIADPYYVIEQSDWVNIVAFDDQQRVLLVEQYRHGIARVTVEFPAGCIDEGESPRDTMLRELLEETGCEVREIFELPTLSASPARATNRIRQFVGVGTRVVGAQALDPSEEISFRFVPIADVIRLMDEGALQVASQIPNLLMAVRFLNRLPEGRIPGWTRVELA